MTLTDGMTADFYSFDMKALGETATRILNEVKGVNRVVYDVTAGDDRVGVRGSTVEKYRRAEDTRANPRLSIVVDRV